MRALLPALAAISLGTALATALGADKPQYVRPEYISWTLKPVVAPPGTPRGYVEFQNACAACHGPMPARPGTRALAAKYHGTSPAMLADRCDLQPASLRTIVRAGISVMPPFRKTELSDAQLGAIVAYLTRPRPGKCHPDGNQQGRIHHRRG